MGAWESGLGNGGMWADVVYNGGAVVVRVGWEMVLSVVAGEVTYNVKDLGKNTESKVDPKIRRKNTHLRDQQCLLGGCRRR